MTIFIGADHRGFELKNKVIDYLHDEKNLRVEDMGAYSLDLQDDYPDYAHKVAKAVLQNPEQFLGIVICGSGVGVCIAANRHAGIYCGIGFDEKQVAAGRTDDHMNVLSIPSDYVDFEKAKMLINALVETKPKEEEKYMRRLKKMDNL